MRKQIEAVLIIALVFCVACAAETITAEPIADNATDQFVVLNDRLSHLENRIEQLEMSLETVEASRETVIVSAEDYSKSLGYEQSELNLIARVVQAEYGYGDEKDKRLVVSVILNRVDHKDFPNTVEQVIKQKNQFAIANTYTMETLNAVYKEVQDRTDKRILWFQSGSYPIYGTPLFQYNRHFFSGYEGE